MSDQNEIIKEAVNSEVAKALYGDAGSPGAVEAGALLRDTVKTVRLLLAPLQIAAGVQDRFARFVDERIRREIPEERLVPPHSQIIGPSLERLKYIDDTSVLWEMFEELLLKASDRDRRSQAHPAFVHIISQLSHDEAVLLWRLKDAGSFNVVDTFDYERSTNRFFNRRVVDSEVPVSSLDYPDNSELYYKHLDSLSLVSWPVIHQEPIVVERKQTGERRRSHWILTDFGKLFVECCVPGAGYRNLNETVEGRGSDA